MQSAIVYVGAQGTKLNVEAGVFERGEARSLGGCISVIGSTEATFTGSTIESCIATENGGIFVQNSDKQLTFDGCAMKKGTTIAGYGGAGYVGSGKAVVVHSTVSDSEAQAAEGGCFSIRGGTLVVNDTTVHNCKVPNTASAAYGNGGCVAIAAGKLDVIDSTLSSCRGKTGAALNNAEGITSLYNTTIVDALGLAGHEDDGIYLGKDATFKASLLTIQPSCAGLNPFFAAAAGSSSVFSALRGLAVILPVCSGAAQARARALYTLPPLIKAGLELPTCASNTSDACGPLATCKDVAVGASMVATTPKCTCEAPLLPVTDMVSETVAPYVDGCRTLCPLGQVMLPIGVCGCRDGLYVAPSGVCIPCDAGTWSVAGSSKCNGETHKARRVRQALAAMCTLSPCLMCVRASHTPTVCPADKYKLNDAAPVSSCTRCPDGAECTSNSLLGTLDLQPGHWRLGAKTTDIRRCLYNGNGTSPCVGGTNTSVDGVGYCQPGHQGALCEKCTLATQYFDVEKAACTDCPDVGQVTGKVTGLVFGVIAAIVLVALAYKLTNAKDLPRVRRQMRWAFGVSVALNPTAKLKIIYAFLQIVVMMPAIYGVWLPPEYYEWTKSFAWVQFSLISLAPASCIGDYKTQLVFLATVPLIVMVTIVVLSVVYALMRDLIQHQRSGALFNLKRSLHAGFAFGTPIGILIMFMVLPSVSSGLFATFDCERFSMDDQAESVHYYLASDTSVRCSSSGYSDTYYESARLISLVFIAMWPFGMPLATLLLMLKVRGALRMKRATFWTRALGFLHREYRAGCYWWEVVEIARRLALTGVVLLIFPAEVETLRFTFAQVITFCSLCAVALIQPYKRKDINTLAFVANLMLLFVLTIMQSLKIWKDIKETSLDLRGAKQIMGFGDAFGLSVGVLIVNLLMILLTAAFIIHQAASFIRKRNRQMRDAISGLTAFKYSYNLVSFDKFKAAGKLVTHEEMRDTGALTVFDLWEDALAFSKSGKVIIFFSHQWLGWSEPDPNNVHFPVMVEAVYKLIQQFHHKETDVYIWIE